VGMPLPANVVPTQALRPALLTDKRRLVLVGGPTLDLRYDDRAAAPRLLAGNRSGLPAY
jgi:hypothetical protein